MAKHEDMDHTWVTDIAVTGDAKIIDKDWEKVENYQDLAKEIQ